MDLGRLKGILGHHSLRLEKEAFFGDAAALTCRNGMVLITTIPFLDGAVFSFKGCCWHWKNQFPKLQVHKYQVRIFNLLWVCFDSSTYLDEIFGRFYWYLMNVLFSEGEKAYLHWKLIACKISIVGLLNLWVLNPEIQPTTAGKYLEKQLFRRLQKTKLELAVLWWPFTQYLHCSSYYKLSRDDLK